MGAKYAILASRMILDNMFCQLSPAFDNKKLRNLINTLKPAPGLRFIICRRLHTWICFYFDCSFIRNGHFQILGHGSGLA